MIPCVVLLALLVTPLAARKPTPGLIGTYSDAARSVELVVASPNFYLDAGQSLHPALGSEFEARWNGRLLVLRGGTYSFRGAEVVVNGHAVGESGVSLDPGRHSIRIAFQRRGGPAALQLRWKAEHFDWEPVPTDRFFHDPAKVDARAHLVEQGRRLAENLGCANCHDAQSASLRARPGPSLLGIGSRRKRAWLYHWLRDPAGFRADALMPDRLESEQERRDLAAYLAAQVSQLPVEDIGKVSRRDRETGRSLMGSLGCGACHRSDSFSLQGLGSKMDVSTLAAYLQDPTQHDESGEMPSFNLTRQEAKELTGGLTESTNEAFDADFTGGDAARGAVLVQAARCAACHEMANDPQASTPNPPGMRRLRPGRGCLAEKPAKGVPRFRLSAKEQQALTAFVESYAAAPDISPAPVYEFYRRLTKLRCTTCHALDSAKPSPAIPEYGPPLTGLGYRMTSEWLRGVLLGTTRTHGGVELRMPHYAKSEVEPLVAGFARAAGVSPTAASPVSETNPSMSQIGVNMLGTNAAEGGLGCIGCHGFGDHDALGEEGPLLTHVAEKVRHDWFQRWMRDPARELSGTSMPNYFGSLPADDARAKIDVLWAALSLGGEMPLPEGFERVESKPGSEELPVPVDKPIVIRWDMPEATPAAIAVGLPGGLSYCFDAGESRLRYVWRGGFLDMTGTLFEKRDRETKLTRTADILGDVFYRVEDFPFRVGDLRHIPQRRFRGYRLIDGFPEFHYELDGVDVYERIAPTETRSGIVRTFRIADVNQSMWLLNRPGPGYSVQSSLPGAADGELRIPLGRDVTFTFTITARTN